MSFIRSLSLSCAALAGCIALGCEKPEPPRVEDREVVSSVHGYDGSANARLLRRFAPLPADGFGIELTVREVDSIAAWLTALDGDAPAALVAPPSLPL